VKFEDFWQGFLFIHTPSNFALIKEDVGGVAGYVEVLFFFRTIVGKSKGLGSLAKNIVQLTSEMVLLPEQKENLLSDKFWLPPFYRKSKGKPYLDILFEPDKAKTCKSNQPPISSNTNQTCLNH